MLTVGLAPSTVHLLRKSICKYFGIQNTPGINFFWMQGSMMRLFRIVRTINSTTVLIYVMSNTCHNFDSWFDSYSSWKFNSFKNNPWIKFDNVSFFKINLALVFFIYNNLIIIFLLMNLSFAFGFLFVYFPVSLTNIIHCHQSATTRPTFGISLCRWAFTVDGVSRNSCYLKRNKI